METNARQTGGKRGYRFSSLNLRERPNVQQERKTEQRLHVKSINWKRYAIGLGVLFVLYWIVGPSVKVVQLRYQLTDMKDKLVEYQNENKMLQEEMNKMKTNQYIEDVARNKLGMVKEGEEAVYVNEVKPQVQEDEESLKSQEKVGVYLKEWYEKMEAWTAALEKKDGLKWWK